MQPLKTRFLILAALFCGVLAGQAQGAVSYHPESVQFSRPFLDLDYLIYLIAPVGFVILFSPVILIVLPDLVKAAIQTQQQRYRFPSLYKVSTTLLLAVGCVVSVSVLSWAFMFVLTYLMGCT